MYPRMTRTLSLFILSAAAMLSLCSCADTEQPKSASTTDPGVSSIPWDRPEKWESGSQVPGAEFLNSQ